MYHTIFILCTILYHIILYYIILYYIILYYIILYYMILDYIILYYTILYTTLHYTVLYYTILYYTILYYTILYYTILYYTILYYTVVHMIYNIIGDPANFRNPPSGKSQVRRAKLHLVDLAACFALGISGRGSRTKTPRASKSPELRNVLQILERLKIQFKERSLIKDFWKLWACVPTEIFLVLN